MSEDQYSVSEDIETILHIFNEVENILNQKKEEINLLTEESNPIIIKHFPIFNYCDEVKIVFNECAKNLLLPENRFLFHYPIKLPFLYDVPFIYDWYLWISCINK